MIQQTYARKKYLRALKLEKLKRAQNRARAIDWRKAIVDSLFPRQKDFVLSKASALIGQCTRRAGKTHGAGAKLFLAADAHPGSTALYLALTRKSAKRLLWPKLKAMTRQFGIDCTFNESELTVTLANGSQILLYGADQENLVERLRGDAYCIVVIDEAASFGEGLQYTIEEVLEPALMDYQGQMCLIGTPGPLLLGPFYDASTKPNLGWEVHKWSVLDNVHLPHAKKWIADLKKRRGWSDNHPTYLREYCNVWTEDPDSLIYKYNPLVNDFSILPQIRTEWQYALGIDLGFDDPATWVIVAFADDCPNAYIVHAERHSGWIPAQWAELTIELQAKYKPIITVADAGALGKAIVTEMQTRYGIPVEFADKNEKMAHIELMNGDFTAERLFVHESLVELKTQYRTLCKDKTGKKEDPTLPNDLADSGLYSWRHCRNYWYKEAPEEPDVGSAAWYEREEKRQIERLVAQSGGEKPWFENELM